MSMSAPFREPPSTMSNSGSSESASSRSGGGTSGTKFGSSWWLGSSNDTAGMSSNRLTCGDVGSGEASVKLACVAGGSGSGDD